MSKFITWLFVSVWCVLEIVGSAFVGYWLLVRFNGTHMLLTKIGLTGLFMILTIIATTFISAVFIMVKDKVKSKKLDKLKK